MKCIQCEHAAVVWSLPRKCNEYGGPVEVSKVYCALTETKSGQLRSVPPRKAVTGSPSWCPQKKENNA